MLMVLTETYKGRTRVSEMPIILTTVYKEDKLVPLAPVLLDRKTCLLPEAQENLAWTTCSRTEPISILAEKTRRLDTEIPIKKLEGIT